MDIRFVLDARFNTVTLVVNGLPVLQFFDFDDFRDAMISGLGVLRTAEGREWYEKACPNMRNFIEGLKI